MSVVKSTKARSKWKRKGHFHADLRNKHYCEWIQFLRKTENWTKEQIEEYEVCQIKRIVKYAYENTIDYRRLHDSFGITLDVIKTVEDFRKLPFVEKEMIRDHLENFSVKIRGRSILQQGVAQEFRLDFIETELLLRRNWDPKHTNIIGLAGERELDSLFFVGYLFTQGIICNSILNSMN